MNKPQMSDTPIKTPKRIRFKNFLQSIAALLRRAVHWYNMRMSKIYSPAVAAFTGSAVVLVVALILLFIPPYVGVADDGSLSGIMESVGLNYRRQDLEQTVGSYYIRIFLHGPRTEGRLSTHRLFIRFAMAIDDLFTGDNLFDVRFLALIYLLLYLPAVWLILRNLVKRVRNAAEATFLVVIAGLILGDGTIISYFSTLYPEALWYISVIWCAGFCLMLQSDKNHVNYLGLCGLAFSGSFLIISESHCSVISLVLMTFCMRQLMIENANHRIRIIAVTCGAILLIAGIVSFGGGADRFTDTSKLHAMTNGVLLRSQNPAKTLEEFGIDPRFETLTDISCYADYPYTLSGHPEIQEDFLSHYDLFRILLHYARHPFSYFGLLEIGTSAAFQPLRSYIGNYEISAGLPERARNPLFIIYSNFKNTTIPRTTGAVAILAVVYLLLFRKKTGPFKGKENFTAKERQIALDSFFTIMATGIIHISAILFISGTAELERYQMLYGSCIDCLILMFLAEILHRLKFLSDEEVAS